MIRAAAILFCAFALTSPVAAAPDPAFQQWLQSLWPDAQKLGVSRATFEGAIRGLEPDLTLPDLVIPGRAERPAPGQAEFVQTPADYLKEASLARLAAQGRKLLSDHRTTLEQIERQFGVPPAIVLAIWGRETAFGGAKLPYDAIRVLATQAYVGRRKELFRAEFLSALRLLQDGVPRAVLRSSWGGAMGLTQFIPSEFYKYAVDFDGDGRADIWNSIPDALASAAKQLAGKGWQRGKAWAYEVRVPKDADCTIAEPDVAMTIGEWTKRGFVPLRRLSPEELAERASLLMPEGLHGPAFLTPRNYFVIKDYNFSDLYVLFVGNLADRIAGGGAFATPWTKTSQLPTAHLEAIQRVLTERGFYKDKIDGKAGMKTRSALGAYQKASRLAVDCWPSPALLEHMRASR
jgi:lytic murein transglycosylase